MGGGRRKVLHRAVYSDARRNMASEENRLSRDNMTFKDLQMLIRGSVRNILREENILNAWRQSTSQDTVKRMLMNLESAGGPGEGGSDQWAGAATSLLESLDSIFESAG